jgi:hypothetical protein
LETKALRAFPVEQESDVMRSMYQMIIQNIHATDIPNFYDLSKIFINDTNTYFIDSSHLSPDGNKKVAENVAAILDTILQ